MNVRALLLATVAVLTCGAAPLVTASQETGGSTELSTGTQLFQQANYDAAVTRLEHAIAVGLAPADRIRARDMLAISYFALGQIAKATDTIRALLKDDPLHEPNGRLPADYRELFAEIKRDTAARTALEAENATLRTDTTRREPVAPRPATGDALLPGSLPWVDIPGGSFEMGCATGELRCNDDEFPRHHVTLARFRLMPIEVSVAMFQAFATATGRIMPPQPGGTSGDSPVVRVVWTDARQYCEWARGRLPTEAEWEYAARAGTTTSYWWGDSWDATRANAEEAGRFTRGTLAAHRNPWGLYEMSGNVWEWTSSAFQPYPYSATDGREDPQASVRRVLRGGALYQPPPAMRSANRGPNDPAYRGSNIGFRCAQ